MSVIILGIESSCDDTSAAILKGREVLSNVIAGQEVHKLYGGVVPELASRAHQQNIVPVVHMALQKAKVNIQDIDAVAFTRGPGLLGSLMVGTSFAKGFALAQNIPLIEVNHLQAHVLAHFIKNEKNIYPDFPFLTLLVSGGNSQIILVKDYLDMEIIGQTLDDAAGEAFDKCAKIMGIPYPGGPMVDQLAKAGNSQAFNFNMPKIRGLDYSFSGLKTSFLYFLRDRIKDNPDFINEHKADLCASLQRTIVAILMAKLKRAALETNITKIAIAGGVSANSELQSTLRKTGSKYGWKVYIPNISYSLDNAAMIGINGYFKYLKKDFASQDVAPFARMKL